MKYLLLFLFSFPVFAKDALLSWDAAQDPDKFRIYHIINNTEQPVIIVSGDKREYLIQNISNGLHEFTASAVIEGEETEKSNSVSKYILKLVLTVEIVD